MASQAPRIDVHFHLVPKFFAEDMTAAGLAPARGAFPSYSRESAVELMDQAGIGAAITSFSQPAVNQGNNAKGLALAQRCNDYAADLAARLPKRFGAFATVPLPDVEGSVRETERAFDTLKFDGVCLFASYREKYLGDRTFDPFMEFLDARAAVVFVHPAMHPSARHVGLPWPLFMLEYVFDTSRAAVNLLFSGALDRFPRIRFILAHAGGVVPYVSWRLSVSPLVDARLPQLSQEAVLTGLKRFWYDTALAPGPQALNSLRAVADPHRILFGSDWPYCNAEIVARECASLEQPGLLDDGTRAAIDRNNALSLFPRFGAPQ